MSLHQRVYDYCNSVFRRIRFFRQEKWNSFAYCFLFAFNPLKNRLKNPSCHVRMGHWGGAVKQKWMWWIEKGFCQKKYTWSFWCQAQIHSKTNTHRTAGALRLARLNRTCLRALNGQVPGFVYFVYLSTVFGKFWAHWRLSRHVPYEVSSHWTDTRLHVYTRSLPILHVRISCCCLRRTMSYIATYYT